MPKVWRETIEEHRRAVREATLDVTAGLVAKHGLRSVTMSQIAEETGIGRATLYKYFADVESILHEWHEREIDAHLNQLTEARSRAHGAVERLGAVLHAYAFIVFESRRHHHAELAALMHQGRHVTRAEAQLRKMIRELIAEAQESGGVRTDASPDELATYSLHALTGASNLASKASVQRLASVTMTGLKARK